MRCSWSSVLGSERHPRHISVLLAVNSCLLSMLVVVGKVRCGGVYMFTRNDGVGNIDRLRSRPRQCIDGLLILHKNAIELLFVFLWR